MSVVRPIAAVLGNGVGAMPADRGPLSDKILRRMEKKLRRAGGGVGVLVEADDADIDACLPPDVYWTEHRPGRTLDGVLIFGTRARSSQKAVRWRPGAPASRVNAERPILYVDVEVDGGAWDLRVAALHRPKAGGERAAALMDERLRAANVDLAGMDANLRRRAVSDRFPAFSVRDAQVMMLLGRRSTLHLAPVERFDLVPETTDDDHPGILCPRVRPRH